MLHLLLLLLAVRQGFAAKLPATWKVCKQSIQGERDTCLKSAITGAVEELIKGGNPSLGLFPLEPLHFDKIYVEGHGSVAINMTFTDLDINRIDSFTLERVQSDWEHYKFSGEITFGVPVVALGDYEVNGKVLVLPITGKGKNNLTFEDLEITLDFVGKELIKNKKKHFDTQECKVALKTSRLHIYFSNLFNGDKALGDNMNKFLNKNWKLILEDLGEAISKALSEAIKEFSNRIFHKVPMEDFTHVH